MALGWRAGGWSAVGLLASINLLHYANRNVVAHASVFSDLRDAFGATPAEIGLLGTAFMVPHALVTLPVAWLGDHFDRRRVIALGLVVWSAAGVLSALATGMGSLLLARAAVGAATAACVPMANALICDVVPPEKHARTMGIYNLGLFLGGVVGVGAAGMWGFPVAFIAVAAPGFLLALLILRIPTKPRVEVAALDPKGSWLRLFFRETGLIFAVRPLRWMMLGAVLMAFAAGGYVHWFIEYLVVNLGFATDEASALFGLALVGGLAGVVTGGFVADAFYQRTKAGRQLAISLGFGLSAIAAALLLSIGPGPVFYVVSFLLMFFISWYHGPIVAAVDDLVPPERAATAQGTYIGLMHLFGTAPSSYVVGVVAGERGLRQALFVPTASMAAAALCFAAAAMGVSAIRVVNKQQ